MTNTISPQQQHGEDIAVTCWTPEQLAAGLGVSVRTLNKWHRLRQGPARVKLGHMTLYRRETVSRWLAERESGMPRRRA